MTHDLIGFTSQAYRLMTWQAIELLTIQLVLLLWTGFVFGWSLYGKIVQKRGSAWTYVAAGCVVAGIACGIMSHAVAFWNGYTYAIDHKARNASR